MSFKAQIKTIAKDFSNINVKTKTIDMIDEILTIITRKIMLELQIGIKMEDEVTQDYIERAVLHTFPHNLAEDAIAVATKYVIKHNEQEKTPVNEVFSIARVNSLLLESHPKISGYASVYMCGILIHLTKTMLFVASCKIEGTLGNEILFSVLDSDVEFKELFQNFDICDLRKQKQSILRHFKFPVPMCIKNRA